MLTEIYYEIDEFNQLYLEKIALYASRIGWYSKRKLGCMSMSEIMTILIYYHYSHYKNFKHYYLECISKDLKKDFPVLVGYDRFVWYIPMAFYPCFVFIYTVAANLNEQAFTLLTVPKYRLATPKELINIKFSKGLQVGEKHQLAGSMELKYT